MQNLVLSPIDPEKLISSISDQVTENILKVVRKEFNKSQTEVQSVFDEYIPKTEVRGKWI